MTPEQQMAILIPTRNRPAILKRTLEELLKLGFGRHPLLVYDDASDQPAEIEKVVSIWPGARLLCGDTRCGQAKGRNQLMKSCPCQYALFLDDDSFPETRESIISALKLVMQDDLGVATFTYKALADGALSVPLGQQRRQAAGFLGGASLFNVPGVMKVGGYRECLVFGCEEPELAMRLWLAGTKVEYLPGIIILHNQFYTPDENRDCREYDYLYARNTILFSSLNMPIYLGLPHGLLRAIRWSVYRNRNYTVKLCGLAAGVFQSFSRWHERQPCGLRRAVVWMRFQNK